MMRNSGPLISSSDPIIWNPRLSPVVLPHSSASLLCKHSPHAAHLCLVPRLLELRKFFLVEWLCSERSCPQMSPSLPLRCIELGSFLDIFIFLEVGKRVDVWTKDSTLWYCFLIISTGVSRAKAGLCTLVVLDLVGLVDSASWRSGACILFCLSDGEKVI